MIHFSFLLAVKATKEELDEVVDEDLEAMKKKLPRKGI
jgi:hypothetical protein